MGRVQINHVVCPRCGARNRFPVGKPPAGARCGKCHGVLFDGHSVAVDARGFERHRSGNDIAVLVDVWAPWCGPCHAMAPMFEHAATELEPDVRLIKVNADEEPGLSAELGVRGIPTMILLQGGKVVARTAGAMDASRIVAWTRAHLSRLKEAGSYMT